MKIYPASYLKIYLLPVPNAEFSKHHYFYGKVDSLLDTVEEILEQFRAEMK